MPKKAFKAESKRLLDLMIHSIYTHKEIFLRELISNASDALDKRYYLALTDESGFDRESFAIRLSADKQARTLTVADTGVGMARDELESNLGTIARSGSLDFKTEREPKEGVEIIGQFGVGFYSAFMVADRVTVRSRAAGAEESWEWTSLGSEGYTIQPCDPVEVGTQVILRLKPDGEDERYGDYLEEYRLRAMIKKYSDFIRYPIQLLTVHNHAKTDAEGKETGEHEEHTAWETVNSMAPLWRKNKNELTQEDYDRFYQDKHFGFEKPLRHIHINADGAVSYTALLYIPAKAPYDFYTRDYEKGLELYTSGVLITQKCAELLPDYFSFVQGLVDSADLSLNISRELLQHDRQLKLIAKRLQDKIKGELKHMLQNDRETYEGFFESFGRQLKYGVYADWGAHKDILRDLLLFYSSTEKKPVTLDEYVSRMKEEQTFIYYAAGQSADKLDKLPQAERIAERGYEILYFTDEVDEFAIRVLRSYQDKEFKSVSAGDAGLETEKPAEDGGDAELLALMKAELADRVREVRPSGRLKSHPVCLVAEGELSIEMEKVLSAMPGQPGVKAEKILEINTGHEAWRALKAAFGQDEERVRRLTRVLYTQALLIEGLPAEDPVAYANDVCALL
jgi:molecular chaperone HtpG